MHRRGPDLLDAVVKSQAMEGRSGVAGAGRGGDANLRDAAIWGDRIVIV